MKNVFRFLMAVAILFTASCAKEDISSSIAGNGEAVEVTFSANLADLGTRAYGEGAHANTLQFFVYEWAQDGVGHFLPDVLVYTGDQGSNVITKNGGNKFTFSLTLVKGMRYNILFWADKGNNNTPDDTTDDSIYSVDSATGVVTADYDGVLANNETLDAFFGKLEDFDPATDAAEAKEITLKRPFAQLNAFTDDLAIVEQSGKELDKSSLTVNTYTTLNLFNGDVYDVQKQDVTFNLAGIPAGENHISMNYLLAPAEKCTANVTFDYTFTDATIDFPATTYTFVPLKRNYRTNIKGKLLTQATDFTVEILPGFDGEPDGLVYDVWDGVSVTVPETTTNENNEPVYNVDSGSDLAWLANLVNGTTRAAAPVYHIVLANDIDLAGHNWTPVGTEANNFAGTFDGQGHTIANLSIVETEAKEGKAYMGFFGYAKDATIKNITFNNVNINIPCLDIDHSQGHIGAVAGSLEGTSTIENVTVKGNITVYTTQDANGASRVAVIAGGNSYGNVTMKNVHVVAAEGSSLIANNNVGALAGQLQGKMVFENCSSNINVTANKFFAGGLVGIAAGDSYIKDCHTTGNVAVVAGREGRHNDEFRVGGIAGGWADGKTKVFTLEECLYTGTISGKNVDGTVAKPLDYAGYVGRGYTLANCAGSKVIIDGTEYVQVYNDVYGVYTVNGAYEVNSVADLKALANDVNAKNTFEGKTVVLTADIDLKNENWTPIGYWETFNGTFDGQGHTISNLKHHGTAEDCYVGLFGYTANATLKNLTINNVDLKLVANADWAGGHMGALVGNIEGNTLIENITVTGCVKIEGDLEKAGAGRIGGVVGGNTCSATLKNVVVNASEGSFVKGNSSVGGIAGQLQDAGTHHISFENCSSNIDVYAQQFYAGGIIGLTAKNSSFTNCSASGNISVLAGRAGNDNDLYRVGGIAGGWDDGENSVLTLTGCSYDAKLSGASADGRTATAFDCAGFVGRGYSTVIGAKVSVNGTVYEYAGEGVYKIDESYVVNTGDALVAALAQKYDVTFGGDLKINPANMSNAYGKTGVLVYDGQTIDGAGYKLDVKGAGGTWDSGICTSGGLIKNIWVTGAFRGIFVKGATHVEKIVLDNVRVEGTTYTISIDQASQQGLEATNSIFRGWTSYAGTIGEVKFDGCTFGAGNGYNFSRPYAPTTYVNCTFEAGHAIDPRAAVTFENCTFNGVALTAENLATLVTSNIANASVK